jgi:hypothetical protein
VLNKNLGSVQKRNPKISTMIRASQQDSIISRTKGSLAQERKPNQEKDISEIQCFNCQKYGHYKNHYPELKKRKEKHEASTIEEK